MVRFHRSFTCPSQRLQEDPEILASKEGSLTAEGDHGTELSGLTDVLACLLLDFSGSRIPQDDYCCFGKNFRSLYCPEATSEELGCELTPVALASFLVPFGCRPTTSSRITFRESSSSISSSERLLECVRHHLSNFEPATDWTAFFAYSPKSRTDG
jgi:hypothetical protein